MTMKYIQIMPAEDWYLIHDRTDGQLVFYRLIGWGLDERGRVEGIVPVTNQDGAAVSGVPGVKGSRYRHVSRMTPKEIEALAAMRLPG
mgnify:FL=1